MSTIRLDARAKLNLSLHVVGRVGDVHAITSVMQSLLLSDRLEIEKADETSLWVSEAGLADGSNLVCKALRELEARVGRPLPLAIRLEKEIPAAAGLGGASADAAALLRAADRIYELGLTGAELSAVGRRVGSDVPFALVGGSAYVAATGEEVVPLPFLGDLEVLLAVPDPPLLTGQIYAGWDELAAGDASCLHPDPHRRLGRIRPGDRRSLAGLLHNDLLEPAARRSPGLRRLLRSWRQVTPLAGMSGSGPTLFALPVDRSETEELERLARREGARIFRTRFARSGVVVREGSRERGARIGIQAGRPAKG
ncbi:MAG: 4-(cytidine 5'-diphospho)-2-C-methyl-D-erythritol kinase [Bacillota bacterium]|nr:4-(cytidine 5'-diphospho)-2-C-methyl-D-erythritol kinase [Bacillota bacterium]